MTLEELEAKVLRMDWQFGIVAQLAMSTPDLAVGRFVVQHDLTEDEFNALNAVFVDFDARESFTKEELSTALLAEVTAHPATSAQDIVEAFQYSHMAFTSPDKWLSL